MSIRTYWVDGVSHTDGDGSESSPFTYNQLVNYFNPDLGDACGIVPENGDVFNINNNISFVSSNTLFSIKRNLQGKVTLKSSLETNIPWMIDTAGSLYTDLNFFKNESGYSISDLEVRDFIFCQNNEGNNVFITMVDIVSELPVEVIFKNIAIFAKRDVSIATVENVVSKYYGCTFNVNNLFV